jgi:hypothetical protein
MFIVRYDNRLKLLKLRSYYKINTTSPLSINVIALSNQRFAKGALMIITIAAKVVEESLGITTFHGILTCPTVNLEPITMI